MSMTLAVRARGRSLQFYKDNNIPIYGSGLTIEEACAPLQWEDHGNTFAFFAVLAFGPESAWVTDTKPGLAITMTAKRRF